MQAIAEASQKGAAATLSAASSAGVATMTWVVKLNAILQLGATAVAIVAGVYAIMWHRARLIDMERKIGKTHERVKKVAEEVTNDKSN